MAAGNAELVTAWLITLIWTALSAPLVRALVRDASLRGSPRAGLVWLFLGVGLLMWVSVLHSTLGRLRFGRLVLELDPAPGSIGGHVGGSLRLPVRYREDTDYRVCLSCIRSRVRSAGKRRHRVESVVWSRERVPVVKTESRGVRLRFTFDVPADLPPSQERSHDYHYWVVRIEGRIPGVDLDRVFTVPVERSDPPRRAVDPAAGQSAPTALVRGGSDGVRVDRRGGHTILRYRVGRSLGPGVGMAVIGLVFAAVPVGVFASHGSRRLDLLTSLLRAPFPTIFGLVGVVMVILGLYTLLNELTVRVSSSEIVATRRVLLFRRERRASVRDVERLEMKVHGRVGSGVSARVSFRITARLAEGGPICLGDGIRGSSLATEVAQVISETTGLPVEAAEFRTE